MTSPLLTLIFGFRDREPLRVKRCLDSLARQTFTDFEVIFVDYGSSQATVREVQPLVESYDFCRYVYTETRGYPWNRAHALNIGIKLATSEYTMTSDIDMVFLENFIEVAVHTAAPDRAIFSKVHLLPEAFNDWDHLLNYTGKFSLAVPGAFGGGLCLPTRVYHDIGAFDEYYCYWGYEDTDIHHRVVHLMGFEETWITDTPLFHQWHPEHSSHTLPYAPRIRTIPDSVWQRVSIHYTQNQNQLARNPQGWGKVHTREDRPVFDYLDMDTLTHADGLETFDFPPSNPMGVLPLLDILLKLAPGRALVVHNYHFPNTSKMPLTRALWMINRYLTRKSCEIDYSKNQVKEFLEGFLLDEHAMPPHERLVADYYLGFGIYKQHAILIRAE